MKDQDYRAHVLASLGASDSETDELLRYNENTYDHTGLSRITPLPLPDEPFISVWEKYESEAIIKGAFDSLKGHLVQLRFLVRKGISEESFYRSVTLRGVPPQDIPQATGLELKRSDLLHLTIHPTLAGRIPIISTPVREEFVALVRALTKRNEPAPIPKSMGSAIVTGYNNWDRIVRYRARWETENRRNCSEDQWKEEFRRIIPQKNLYQDRFIILSDGPYSAVSAPEMGLSEDEWQRLSLIIRREHECTHYATLQLFSSMQNRLIDELIADYIGIVAATGRYRADWFLRFLGLEHFPEYREGGRLENYRGKPPLSDGSFKILQTLAKKASENLEEFDRQHRDNFETERWKAIAIMILTCFTIEELSSEKALSILQKALRYAERICV
ncbi:MAG: hypothetical protein JRD69_02425 [Deltaproteobacteria bacterium]|nr:hypothetical protein [Deltaproteobacteria bacterium]